MKFDNLPNLISDLDTEWNGHSGMEVEDLITRQLEKAQGGEIQQMEYDLETSILSLKKANGETVTAEVSVIPPTYSYGIMLYGIDINGTIYTSANSSLLMQYNSDKTVKLGIALYAVSTTSVTVDRVGPFSVKINYGTQSLTAKVNNIKYADCVIDSSTGAISSVTVDPSELAWIDISKLFSKSQTSKKITATIEDVENTLELAITNEVISLAYTGNTILTTNSASFSLTGGTISNYYLEGYNNGTKNIQTTKGVMTISSLTAGLNRLVVRAVNSNDSSIYTDYIYIDVIYTVGCTDTVVAVNGVSSGISNNCIATLYKLSVYSPNLDSVNISTYLESEMPDTTDPNPTEIMKYEVINASSYDENNSYETSYQKYIEINSDDSERYLLIKVDGVFYNFYTVVSNKIYSSTMKTMAVEAVDRNLIYYLDIAPSKNFDLIGGYLNDIFMTSEYYGTAANVNTSLESSDGWFEDSGRTYFKVSAQDTPVFTTPVNFSLTNQFTIEFGFKTYNISNEEDPVFTFGNLQLRPTLLCWNTTDETLFNARNSQFQEDTETHIVITVLKNYSISKGDAYFPDFLEGAQSNFENYTGTINLMRIYINGCIDREISLLDSELSSLMNSTLQINPTSADINFYLFRVYNTVALTHEQVIQNRISFLKDKDEKIEVYEFNDLVGTNGEISFDKAFGKVNTLVYVYPSGGKFPNRAWGGEDGSLNNKANNSLPVTLFVNYADEAINKQYGGRITKGLVKGQGSSAMRYLIWNVAFQLNKFKSTVGKSEFTPYSQLDSDTNTFVENANVTEGYYVMPPYDGLQETSEIKVTKTVGKVNFASSMQSHKIGACKLYDDAYKRSLGALPTGGLKAVHEEPFLYFYLYTDLDSVDNVELADILENSNIKFMGFQTWGSAKGDTETFGYNDNSMLLLEGGENSDPSSNFRVPWLALQRMNNGVFESAPTLTYEESLAAPWQNLKIDDESIYHNARGSWDIDFGVNDSGDGILDSAKDSLTVWRSFYDFVYKYDYNLKIYNSSTPNNWDVRYKYVVTSSTCTLNTVNHKSGDIYRYDEVNQTWVKAGYSYNGGWDRLNIYDLAGTTSTIGIAAALDAIKEKFAEGIKEFAEVDDVAFHQAFVKFMSGTDNRAKNTYFLVINGKIYLISDDLDTVLKTDNNGLQSKPYNLLEPSFDETTADYWGDANNIFFYMFDQCFESNVKTQLQNIISTAYNQSIDVNDTTNYFYKNFFGVQEGFPAIAYNHTAQIYYENAQFIKNSNVLSYYTNNEIAPIEQSHGSCLEGEKQFMSERLPFLCTYAQVNLGSPMPTGSSAGSGQSLTLRMEFEPYQDFYPNYKWETTYYLGEFNDSEFDAVKRLTKAGNTYVGTILQKTTAINLGIYSTNLYKTLNITGLKTSSLDSTANFERLTKLYIDNDDLNNYDIFESDYPSLSLSLFNPSLPVLKELTLKNLTLPDEIDLSGFSKLQSVDLTNTTVKNVILPQSSRLTTLILPETIESLKIYDNPSLQSIDIQGISNLRNIYIEGSKVGNFDVSSFCEQLINCNLTSVVMRNVNLYITEDALKKLIYADNCILTGDIHIVTTAGGSTLKNISFETKKLLVNTFGDITNSATKIYYQTSEIIDFSCATEISVYYQNGESGTITRQNLFGITVSSGNDVDIVSATNPFNPEVTGYLNITYSSISGISKDVAEIDTLTGAITLKKESTATGSVTVSMKVANSSTPITKTVKVSFAWKAPNIGDFAYADGTFTSSYDSSKTLVGLVYAKDTTSDTAGTVYIIGKEFAYDSVYLGYTDEGQQGSSNSTIALLYLVSLFLSNNTINDYNTISGIANQTLIDSISVTTYNVSTSASFSGDTDTSAYIDHVNTNLLPVLYNNYTSCKAYITRKSSTNGYTYSIDSLDNLTKLLEVILTIYTNASSSDIMTCLLYPYFYSMYLYQPSVNSDEQLNDQYLKGNWYAPSVGEFSRIIYYRGYSAKGANFNSSYMCRSNIDSTLTSGSTDLSIPIFSLALKQMGNKFPSSAWTEVVGTIVLDTIGNAGVNNIPTTVNNTLSNNYSYQNEGTWNNNDIVYTDKWIVGNGTSSNYYTSWNIYLNAWRLTKHKGLPFTKFNYSKNG